MKKVWIFGSTTATLAEIVTEVQAKTNGMFGNSDAPICEALPVAATEMHHCNGKAYIGVLLREDFAQQWYAMQDAGQLTAFNIDTTRPIFKDVLDENGQVIGQIPNKDPYKYGTVNILDEQGNPTGQTQDLYMLGPG